MKKSALALFVLSMSFLTAAAQEAETVNVTRVTFLSPGISQEIATGKSQTFFVAAYAYPSFAYNYSSSQGSSSSFSLDPGAEVHYRFYYNGTQRADNGKRVEMNSMNYLGPIAQVIFTKQPFTEHGLEESNRRPLTMIGAQWGLQRNYNSRFCLDLNLGFGYQFGKNTEFDLSKREYTSSVTGRPALIADIKLGFWLNRRQ